MLEIRLYELYYSVTLFLIAESNLTFSGKPKPFYLKENWSRFTQYHNKIRRVEINLINLSNKKINAWDHERIMRDEGIRLALPNSTKDFLLLTSDLDEIPKSRFVRALASCPLPTSFQSLLLKCDFYYYSFEFRHTPDEYFHGGTVSRFSPNARIPTGLREARLAYRAIPGACFHCSYCLDRVESVQLKLASFSHTELDIPKFHDEKYIIHRFRYGKDLYDRAGESFRRVNINEIELPQLLQIERERFNYMLNRSSPNAAFRDIQIMKEP